MKKKAAMPVSGPPSPQPSAEARLASQGEGVKPQGARKRKRKGGRPPKVTISKVQEIGALMALGVPEDYACALHGINPETFGPAVSRSPAYKAAMKVHHAKFMAESLQIIRDGGERVTVTTTEGESEKILPWTGRAWILERRYKPHFNKTEVVKPGEAAGESGGLLKEKDLLELEALMKREILGGGDGEKVGKGETLTAEAQRRRGKKQA